MVPVLCDANNFRSVKLTQKSSNEFPFDKCTPNEKWVNKMQYSLHTMDYNSASKRMKF